MTDVVGFINTKLAELEIPYEYLEWKSAVTYPYFVGSYSETEYRYEDNYTAGIFTIDGWSRGSEPALVLSQIIDTIKTAFEDLQEVSDGVCYYVRYASGQLVPSGEEDLCHAVITLNIETWKGS